MTGRDTHFVECPRCEREFELFGASWCRHPDRPSKRCPHCRRCLCDHPSYAEPTFWTAAGDPYRHHGFHEVFLYYR